MGKCKDCEYYIKCVVDNRNYGGMTCSSPKVVKGYNTRNYPVDSILVENDEGWAIIVGPEFGCVNWEQKEKMTGVVNLRQKRTSNET